MHQVSDGAQNSNASELHNNGVYDLHTVAPVKFDKRNTGKLPRIPNNLIISGAVHGQISGPCLGVVCQTVAGLGYETLVAFDARVAMFSTAHSWVLWPMPCRVCDFGCGKAADL